MSPCPRNYRFPAQELAPSSFVKRLHGPDDIEIEASRQSGRSGREGGGESRPGTSFSIPRCTEGARPRPDHRRVRRRSVGDRHLQPGRRAARLRHRLDHDADVSADGGDPGNFRAGRPRHRPRHFRQCVPALFVLVAPCGGDVAVRRQHHQHRRRSRRDGGCQQTADRRPQHHLCPAVRRDLGGGADLPRLRSLRLGIEMADAQPVCLCRGARLRQCVVGRGARGHPRSAHDLECRLLHHHRRDPRHHDLALSVLLAGLAGSRGSARRRTSSP